MLFAFGHPSDPENLFPIAFAAGVCLFYAKDKATRCAGVLFALAAAMAATGPAGDSDNFWIALAYIAIAIVVVLLFRPAWMRK